MRFATWNCCSGGVAKVPALERHGVDAAVICEAPLLNPRPAPTLTEPALGWLSAGDTPNKGVAIATFGAALVALDPRAGQGQWTVAASLADGPSVLGLWSRPPRPSAGAYRAQVVASLDAYADLLDAGDMIVAGDFNIGQPAQGLAGSDGGSVARTRWEELGLVSVYHAFHGEPFGAASRSTYFHQRKEAAGWHIDYVLIHRSRMDRVRDVHVGTFQDWVAPGHSDHVPLIVDLDW